MKNATLETRKQEAVQTNEPRVTLDIKKITSNQKLIASMDTYVFNKAMFFNIKSTAVRQIWK